MWRLILQHIAPSVHLQLVFVGDEIAKDGPMEPWPLSPDGFWSADFVNMSYEKYQKGKTEAPDLVVAFNPGFHRPEYTWKPTLELLVDINVSVLVTCRTEEHMMEMVALQSLGIHIKEENLQNPFMSHVPRLRPLSKSLIEVDNHSYIVFVGRDTLAANMENQQEDMHSESQQLAIIDVVEGAVENPAGPSSTQAVERHVETFMPPQPVTPSRRAPSQQSSLVSLPRERGAMPSQGPASSSSSTGAIFGASVESALRVVQPASGVPQPASAPARRIGGDMLRDDTPATGKVRKRWTMEEEEHLIDGQQRYGNKWETIRKNCQLQHRRGTQIRDKWVNLLKAGKVRVQPY